MIEEKSLNIQMVQLYICQTISTLIQTLSKSTNDQEMPQSHTADQPTRHREEETQYTNSHTTDNWSKAPSLLFPSTMIAKKNKKKQWEQQSTIISQCTKLLQNRDVSQ